MMKLAVTENEIVDVCKYLKGFNQESNFYVGGSYAQYKYFKGHPAISPNDIDIYINTPKQMERWAMVSVLKGLFDEVIDTDNGGDYDIVGQYWLFKCVLNGTHYDLIFVDAERKRCSISDIQGSTLARILYQVADYRHEYNWKLVQDEARDKYISHDMCDVISSNTKEQLEKLKRRCEALGITMIEPNPDRIELTFAVTRDSDFGSWYHDALDSSL